MATKSKKEKKPAPAKVKKEKPAPKVKEAKSLRKASPVSKKAASAPQKQQAKAHQPVTKKLKEKTPKIHPKKEKILLHPQEPLQPKPAVESVVKPAAAVQPHKQEKKEPVLREIRLPEPPKPHKGPPKPAQVEKAAAAEKPQAPKPAPEPARELKEIELSYPVTVKDLSVKLQEKPSSLIKILIEMKIMAGINQALDDSTVAVLGEKFGFKIKKAPDQEASALKEHEEADRPEELKVRPPIVTFMGHVDHGKTSLLDAIRKSKVVDKEHGGITQHIGAYRVIVNNGSITFLDTPGHEAFTAMRARGASVTDIVVLVVAADDGIMPQTEEAIDHARAAGVSIIVAINKIDKPQADIDRVKKQLGKMDLLAEDWGGKTITCPVSAKTGEGIDNLLEMIILEAQMLELKANPERLAKGIVIEAKMSKGRGPVSTLIVQNGTLHLNDSVVIGKFYGKIRGMFDDHGRSTIDAMPAYPVEVLGVTGVPEAGEQFFAFSDDKQAKEIVSIRQERQRQQQMRQIKHITLEELYTNIKEGKIKELKLIIKADVQGSLGAIKDTIQKIDVTEIKISIIHEGVGNINSSDVILAAASDALILGFNVKQDELALELSAKEGVEVRIYNIIYELSSEIKAALEGMLEPKLKKVFLGRAEVRKVFNLSRSGAVAGCFVSKGKITRNCTVNLLRNGESIYEGSISNLKRFKDDVRDVQEGFECGISLKNFDTMQEGDVIEAYEIEKIARKL